MTTTTTRLGTPLAEQAIRHVNFFNGRLVTQGDMARTQQAQHEADARLGQGVGAGVVHGLEIAIADAAQRQLRVTAGLGLNAAGQTLCLGSDQLLALAPTPDAGSITSTGGFGRCGTQTGGGYVAGNGLYLLTLAPLSVKEGKAPVLALDPGNAGCNSDAIVEAVQLRLLRIEDTLLAGLGLAANPVGAAAVSKWRSAVAYACFGYPALAAAHAQIGTAPAGSGLLQRLRTVSLSDCELPLGLVYLTASAGIAFIDAWAVRRRVAGEPASAAWSAWFGPGLDALGEAQLAQFQQQLSEVPSASLAGLKAADWFAWLPPAGFLDAAGTRRVEGMAFLDSRKPARTAPLAPGDVRALLGQALRRDAVNLGLTGNRPRFRLYAVEGGPQFFVREAPNAPHAEEVWLDGQRARLPGVNDVQAAIDELRARVCGERSVWPGMDAQALIDGLAPGADLTLCFEAGRYALDRPLQLQGLGHLVIRGNGAASLLSCRSGEAALIVNDCDSLTISDLAVEGGRIAAGKGELGAGLLGALTVVDVPSVHIERLSAGCDDAAAAGAACIVVRQSVALSEKAEEAVEEAEAPVLFKRLRKLGLASGGTAEEDGEIDEAEMRRRERLLKRAKAKAKASDGSVGKLAELTEASHVCIVDCDLLIGAAQIGILCTDNALTDIRHNRLRGRHLRRPPERGIVVAGSSAEVVTIADNVVIHAAQGIAIGLSQSESAKGAPLAVERASVLNNRVQIGLGERELARNRFGIFVGNAVSLAVEGNRVTQPLQAKDKVAEAIRLTGVYGLMLYVRGNHTSGTENGILFSPVAPLPALDANSLRKGRQPCLWLFEGNLAEQATEVLQVATAAKDLVTDVLNVVV